eukprot:6793402-Alexandrium_andersonii.AAC.1
MLAREPPERRPIARPGELAIGRASLEQRRGSCAVLGEGGQASTRQSTRQPSGAMLPGRSSRECGLGSCGLPPPR